MTASKFFQQINYASFHEDSNSERRALSLQPADRVLCLTGSGARALDLLLDDPAQIVALDWNPSQSYLLELKIAVIRKLSYEAGMAFLGFASDDGRAATYSKLRDDLTPEARAFWDGAQRPIASGVFFNGRWERFLRRASWLARWTRRGLVQQLMDAETVAHQHEIWKREWDNRVWRTFLAVATNRLLVRYLLREPGLDLVPRHISINQVIAQRFRKASSRFLFRESPWVWALFKGCVEIGGPLPEHLQAENFEFLRQRIDRIDIRTGALQTYLNETELRFDAFSLSDFCSYCDQTTYNEIWKQVLQCSLPGARICERRFLVDYSLNEAIKSEIQIDQELAKQLEHSDRSLVYTFLAATKKQ